MMSNMKRITDENLDALIFSLAAYKEQGIVDPWILDDGTEIQPLDTLMELQEWRNNARARKNA